MIAEKMFINGNIYTVDDCIPKASCIGVRGDRIVYVGGYTQAKFLIGQETEIIDLGGKTVVPGFIESHLHLDDMGRAYTDIDVYRKPKQEILNAVKERAEKEPDEWIEGGGWLETLWEGEDRKYPSRAELDAVAPDTPVFLSRFGGHMHWANSKALQLAGISDDTPDPQGGEYLRDENGHLTGCLCDNAAIPVENAIPKLSGKKNKDGILKAQEYMLSRGVTSFTHMGALGSIEDFFRDVEELYAEDAMKLRGTYCLKGPSIDPTNEELEHWYAKGPVIDAYDDRFTVRSVKLFADGSLGARSAALEEDYADRPGWNGQLLNTDEQFEAIVDRAASFGWQVITHAIGDRAIHQVMNAYEKAINKYKLDDHRYHIEHFQVINDGDAERARELGIIPSMQATNATFNYPMPDERLGDRVHNAYAWRKVLDAGCIIAGGTDAPITPVDPMIEFISAVLRTQPDGQPEGGWCMENAVTREEALKSQTIWAAYAVFEEKNRGSITKGKLADFVVLSDDIMTCAPEKLYEIVIERTVIGGETLYKS